jgi:hypothetical protein
VCLSWSDRTCLYDLHRREAPLCDSVTGPGSAIRYRIFSGGMFLPRPLNGGEYHTEMKLAA